MRIETSKLVASDTELNLAGDELSTLSDTHFFDEDDDDFLDSDDDDLDDSLTKPKKKAKSTQKKGKDANGKPIRKRE